MLKEKVTELMDRYESGDENLTAGDVMEELENILDEEEPGSELSEDLRVEVNELILANHQAARHGDHGGESLYYCERFIAAVERIIGYNA